MSGHVRDLGWTKQHHLKSAGTHESWDWEACLAGLGLSIYPQMLGQGSGLRQAGPQYPENQRTSRGQIQWGICALSPVGLHHLLVCTRAGGGDRPSQVRPWNSLSLAGTEPRRWPGSSRLQHMLVHAKARIEREPCQSRDTTPTAMGKIWGLQLA